VGGTGCGGDVGDFVDIVFADDGVEVEAAVLYLVPGELLQGGLHAVDDGEELAFGELLAAGLHLFRALPHRLLDVLVVEGGFEPEALIGEPELIQSHCNDGSITDVEMVDRLAHIELVFDHCFECCVTFDNFVDNCVDVLVVVHELVGAVG
jgi:hypothetical protein